MFPCEYCEMFKYSFLYRTSPVHYTFPRFYVIEFLEFSGYKIDIFHISCTIALFSFITLVLESEVDCYFVYILFLYQNFVYKNKIYTNYNDSSFTILIVSLKFRNSSKIIATSQGNLLWKMSIWILCYVIIFL